MTVENWVRIVSVADLQPGMKVARGRSVWTVDANLGWRFFDQGKRGRPAAWNHIILFRRPDGGEFNRIVGGEEVSFFWAFKNSDVTVDVLE